MVAGSNRRRAVVLGAAAAACIGVGAWIVGSASLRASLSAGYRAFRDPALIAQPAPSCPEPSGAVPWRDGIGEGAGLDDLLPEAPAVEVDGGAAVRVSTTLSDLPIPVTRRTLEMVRYFAEDPKGRDSFSERFRRAGRYRAPIERALREAGIPEDMLWVSAVVSGFVPQATSPEGAAGLFQFMPETAARYGLAQNDHIDERKSIPRSAAAAIAHLNDLFERYGSWELALAGYQVGQERLDAAIEKLRASRKPADEAAPIALADLAERKLVPRATTSFVAQVHAFALVAANRGMLGLDELDPAAPMEFAEIAVPQGTRLQTIAAAAGISLATLRDYNPELLRDRLPPTGGDVLVNLPADRIDRATSAFPAYLAREAAEGGEAAPAASASAGAAPSASAAARPAAAPRERWILDEGIAVERVAAASEQVEIGARVELREPTRTGWRDTGERFAAAAVTAPASAIDRGLEKSVERAQALVAGGAEADVALRRRVAAARRPMLEGLPYGSSWIALSEALFPEGHPLAGAMLAGFLQPAAELLFSDHVPRSAARLTISIRGPSERGAIDEALARALGPFSLGAGAPFGPHPREERRTVAAAVAGPRLLIGWIAPRRGDPREAATRLAMAVLVHGKIGRAQRAMVLDRRVAARVRGVLELGHRGSVAAIEVVPAVPHDVAAAQAALDQVIEEVSRGTTPEELGAAKALISAGLDKERLRAASAGALKERRVHEVETLVSAVAAATAEDVRGVAKDVLSREHRVLVVTEPRK